MSQSSLIGQTLARQYKITRKLGEGGFGSVYEAEDTRFGRRVAVKTIHPHLLQDPLSLERFRREGLAASRLDHPAVVKVFNLLQSDDGLVFMVMEFIEGKTLSETIKERGMLSPQETQLLLQPICEALEEAHKKGIIHRDLKPKNIMLTPTAGGFFAKVLDFGISRIASEAELTQTSSSLGTPAYMAPEQWQANSKTTPATDIYALGLIVYRCLSGKLPFEANTSTEWMKQHCSTPPIPLSTAAAHIPEAVSRFTAKALSKEPSERHATPMVFYQDYCHCIDDTTNDTIPVDTSDTVFDPRMPALIVKPENLSLPTLLRGDAQDPALQAALQKNTEEEGEKLANKLLSQSAPTQHVKRLPEEPKAVASSGSFKQTAILVSVFFLLLLIAYLLGKAA